MPVFAKYDGIDGESEAPGAGSAGKTEASWKTEEGHKGGTPDSHEKWIDVLSNSDPDPVALLLPAVQAAREAARNQTTDETTIPNIAQTQGRQSESAPDNFVFAESPDLVEPLDALLIINQLGKPSESVWDDTDIVHVVDESSGQSGDWDQNGGTVLGDFLG